MRKNDYVYFLTILVVILTFYYSMKYFGNEYLLVNTKHFLPDSLLLTMVELESVSSLTSVATLIFYLSIWIVRRNVVVRSPGTYLSKVTNFFYSKKVLDRVFDPMMVDMLNEYFEALDEGRIWKSRWIRVNYLVNIVVAMVSQLSISVIKLFIEIWKMV